MCVCSCVSMYVHVCPCVWVQVCVHSTPKNAHGLQRSMLCVLLDNSSPQSLRRCLLPILELTDWIDCLTSKLWNQPVSAYHGTAVTDIPPHLPFLMASEDINPDLMLVSQAFPPTTKPLPQSCIVQKFSNFG